MLSFKTEPQKAECRAGQPTHDIGDVGQTRLGV